MSKDVTVLKYTVEHVQTKFGESERKDPDCYQNKQKYICYTVYQMNNQVTRTWDISHISKG